MKNAGLSIFNRSDVTFGPGMGNGPRQSVQLFGTDGQKIASLSESHNFTEEEDKSEKVFAFIDRIHGHEESRLFHYRTLDNAIDIYAPIVALKSDALLEWMTFSGVVEALAVMSNLQERSSAESLYGIGYHAYSTNWELLNFWRLVGGFRNEERPPYSENFAIDKPHKIFVYRRLGWSQYKKPDTSKRFLFEDISTSITQVSEEVAHEYSAVRRRAADIAVKFLEEAYRGFHKKNFTGAQRH